MTKDPATQGQPDKSPELATPTLAPDSTSRRAFLGKAAMAGASLSALALADAGTRAATAAPGKVPLTFWKYEDPSTVKVMQSLVHKYNAQNPNVQVVLQTFPFDQYLGAKVTTALAAGSGPDIFWVSAATLLQFAPDGLLLPLNDTFAAKYQSDFLPQSLRTATLGGNIYGVPHEMGVQGLVYDKSLFAQHGLRPPATWDDLIRTAGELKTASRYGILLPTNPDVFENFIWYPYLWMAGGDVLSADWSQATINQDPGVKALEFWGTLMKKGLAAPKSSGAFGTELPLGKVAMTDLGIWTISNYKTNYPHFQPGVAPLPAPDSHTQSVAAYGGWYTAVNSATKYPKEAKAFAAWLFGESPDNVVALLNAETLLSVRKSVTAVLRKEPLYAKDPIKKFFVIWPHTRPEPAYPQAIEQAITDAIQAVMYTGSSAKQAANAAADRINSYLATPQAAKIRKLIKH